MRRLISITLFLSTAFLSAQAGENAVLIKEEMKGVYRIYDFDSERVSVAPPKGYKVFYLSHYGRHGSRYLHSEREYDTLNVVLHREQLTPYGEEVREMFDLYYPSLKGRATDLSEEGKNQHRLLARRMVDDYPELFGKDARIEASSSDIPRCLMSMFNFLDELRQVDKSLNINANFVSSMVPLYRASQVKRFPLKEYLQENFDPRPLFVRLFAEPDGAISRTDEHQFAQTLYYYACHLEGVGIQDDFFDSVLMESEIDLLHKVESEKFSYHRGALQPENTMVAGPSLLEIIETTDKDLSEGEVNVRLRFGHDNMIMNLMSLLAVKPFDGLRFDCSDVPMASNIRFVFAKNREGNVLVKIQYNENDMTDWLPWDGFRSDCMARINKDMKKRTVQDKNSEYNPMFMAHRGLQSFGPENSLPAFKAAAERGMWAIETDFRITSDGHIVCVHDKTLDRTTDGTGLIIEKTLEEIRHLKVMPVNTKTVQKQYDYQLMSEEDKVIPTMEEYLEICRNSGSVAFIELKEDNGIIEKMISAIDEYDLHGSCVISSGKIELLERYRSLGGSELIHLIFAKPEQLAKVKELGNASVSFKYADLDSDLELNVNGVNVKSFEELVDYVHSLGIKICFRAADSQETAMKHIKLGVDYIPTNQMYSVD